MLIKHRFCVAFPEIAKPEAINNINKGELEYFPQLFVLKHFKGKKKKKLKKSTMGPFTYPSPDLSFISIYGDTASVSLRNNGALPPTTQWVPHWKGALDDLSWPTLRPTGL